MNVVRGGSHTGIPWLDDYHRQIMYPAGFPKPESQSNTGLKGEGPLPQNPHKGQEDVPAPALPQRQDNPAGGRDTPVGECLKAILTTRFPKGFRLFEQISLGRLRDYAKTDFGLDIHLSDEELRQTIKQCGTLFEQQVYVVSSEAKERIKTEVEEYFTNNKNIIFYEEFYTKNENWLMAGNIVSAQMLRELLVVAFPNMNFEGLYFGNTRGSLGDVIRDELNLN